MLNTQIGQHFKTSPHKKHAANTDAAAQITHSSTPHTRMLDKYIGSISIAIALWLGVLGGIGAVYVLGVKSAYFRWGPAPNLVFVGFPVDSWFRWCEVIVLASISQLLYMIATETVSPWIMNTVMDQKTTTIPIYSYFQVQMICNVYYMFAAVVQMVQASPFSCL